MNLAKLRKEKGMSQAKLSKLSGYRQATISQWETGKRVPSYIAMLTLADVLGVSIDELVSTTKPTEFSAEELQLLECLKDASKSQLLQIYDYAKFLISQDK